MPAPTTTWSSRSGWPSSRPGSGPSFAVSGADIALTPKEFDILECLAIDPGRVVSRQEILESAWDSHWYGPTKVLDVHVAALRRKLGEPGLIETVYGRGFRLSDT